MMASASIAMRNLANAQKSTGPRSMEGKARSARNAMRHGAMASPPEEVVVRWLAIILNRPNLAMEDLDFSMPPMRGALTLAQAEARHVQAVGALQDFEAGEADPSSKLLEDLAFQETLLQLCQAGDGDRGLLRLAEDLYAKCLNRIEDEIASGGKRHRMLKRYVRETRTKRKAALRAWLRIGKETEVPWQSSEFSKRTQTQP
ncbi:hypothetical protein HKCCSP123_02120 [Rhodobacterales bacterium HKCCSP123]|nr:hypothetical protein [Rhodobacterales bacterium HKCCSP123]